jgi:vesicle-fusing ATPase
MSSRGERPTLQLTVGNLPSNRLALTNKVYVSPATLNHLGIRPDKKNPLVRVGPHPFMLEAHSQVEDGQICLNGLQRRYAQLSLATPVSVKYFRPPSNFTLATIEFTVDLLAKKQTTHRGKPREIDSDRLASDVLMILEHQPFEPGVKLALDFEGTKLELTVKDCGVMALEHENAESSSNNNNKYPPTAAGRLLAATAISFSRAEGAAAIALVGDHVQGGGARTNLFLSDFDFEKLGIGGLGAEFNTIFRRAFASRVLPPSELKTLGLSHVRGMLLYGPPGCGKTLIARQIGKVLNAREPKIVNGPEILNKFVGGSEEKIRELFADAEKEQLEAGDQSMLHIVIMDEMDAICKQRGTVRDGTGVSDSVVNQLLSKIDGVDSLNNILLIGMTNRRDMIDDALLRPGRLEVHVEIGLPDLDGRMQILNIHTASMRKAKKMTPECVEKLPRIAEQSKNFSGAEIEGLVKAASSYALTRCVDVKNLSKAPKLDELILEYNDFERALGDIEPKFGAKSQELKACYRNGFVPYGDSFDLLMGNMDRFVEQVRTSTKTPLMSVLLQGPMKSGKTAVAAKVAVDSGFPFVRMISADEMIGYSDSSKCQAIHKAFLDSYKSPLSLIVIDDIERIIEYVPIGPRFSNTVLQTLLVLLKKNPPDEGRRLMVIGTTSCPHLLEDLGLIHVFSVQQDVPLLEETSQKAEVLRMAAHMNDQEANSIARAITKPIGIKQLLLVAEMATQASEGTGVDTNVFMECLHTAGY